MEVENSMWEIVRIIGEILLLIIAYFRGKKVGGRK
jgi:hypothetical protein